jgi:hypothetical protein
LDRAAAEAVGLDETAAEAVGLDETAAEAVGSVGSAAEAVGPVGVLEAGMLLLLLLPPAAVACPFLIRALCGASLRMSGISANSASVQP